MADGLQGWVDKLEIRELIERSLRYTDDRAGEHYAALFDDTAVVQLAGRVFAGRDEIRAMLSRPTEPDPPHWSREEGAVLRQPGETHLTSNPVVDVQRDMGTAETDLVVFVRGDDGRARITLVARYRDRLRRDGDRWVITNRTGVSIARPGEAGTDNEWQRALANMPQEMRANFRLA